MNRQQEIQAIDEYVRANGVYRCAMGEMYYGEEGPGYRERMSAAIERGKRFRVERTKKDCLHCGKTMVLAPGTIHQKYCSPECGHKARVYENRGVNIECDYCGKLHYREQRRNKTKNKFCSVECNKLWRRK
jgi:endogenous inhibitor of DNA gyrase (YacG/DUF329 family)